MFAPLRGRAGPGLDAGYRTSRRRDTAARSISGRPIASDGPVVAQCRGTIRPDLIVHQHAGQREPLEHGGMQLGIWRNAPIPLAPEERALIDELQCQPHQPARACCYGGLPFVVLAPGGIGVELQHRTINAETLRPRTLAIMAISMMARFTS